MIRLAWLAVIVGWAISQAFAFITRYLVMVAAFGSNVEGLRVAASVSALAAGPAGALLGGLVAGRLSRHRTIVHGLLVGTLALLTEALRVLPLSTTLPPALILSWTLLPASGALGGWLGGLTVRRAEAPAGAGYPRWLVGAVAGMTAFGLVGGLLLVLSVKNESGFVYVDSLTTIGYLTQVVLLPGTLAAAVFRSDRFRLSEYTGLVFMLVISGLPWAAVGALLASGRKRWAAIVATVAVLASAIPGILFWLIAKGLGEGPP